MSAERRRLRAGVEVDVRFVPYNCREDWWEIKVMGVWISVSERVLNALTEPIPGEPSGEVEEQAAHIGGQMDAAKSGLRDIDEAYRLGGVPFLVQALRVRAMEAAMRDKDNDRAMADILARVEALEKRMEQQRQEVTITLPPVQVPTPAPKQDTAGGDEPSAEEVEEWLREEQDEYIPGARSHKVLAAAIRLIRAGQHAHRLAAKKAELRERIAELRAGQKDTRPVLTAEMVEEATIAAFQADGSRWHCADYEIKWRWRTYLRKGLLATGAFREVSG